MGRIVIKPFNVVNKADLTEITVDQVPAEGDPIEIDKELYFVCEGESKLQTDHPVIGVIPLVVRNPREVNNINEYLKCLSLAHRKVLFKRKNEVCDLENCDEMVIANP